MNHSYTYESALAASEKATWRIEDLIGGDKQLNFNRRSFPKPWRGLNRSTFDRERKAGAQSHSWTWLSLPVRIG